VFPLISNAWELTAEELLRAYKRQPIIEKRFSRKRAPPPSENLTTPGIFGV
jgi:hypothetical protein